MQGFFVAHAEGLICHDNEADQGVLSRSGPCFSYRRLLSSFDSIYLCHRRSGRTNARLVFLHLSKHFSVTWIIRVEMMVCRT